MKKTNYANLLITISLISDAVESRLGRIDSLLRFDSLYPKSDERVASRTALEEIYDATGGDSWTGGDGWMLDDCACNWEGVTCNVFNVVTGLDLSGFGLSGTLPGSMFGSLLLLNTLNLSNNNLQGTIPPQLGNNIALQTLDLSYNSFRGNIPSEFAQLVRLQTLAVQGNDDLTGGMPLEVCGLHAAWLSGVTDLAALENVYGDCMIGIFPCLCCTQGYNPCCFSNNNTVGTCDLN